MAEFATEFCVSSDISEAKFAALAVGWLRGIPNSTVLKNQSSKELDLDDAWIESSTGESLALKKIDTQSGFVIGLRHEMPDASGRIWRTEGVLTNSGDQAYLRVRSQCVAISPEIPVSTPKKPYFIKTILDEGWGEQDGEFKVIPLPHYLGQTDLELAANVLLGKAKASLPIVYVSANGKFRPNINAKKLAFDLGGIAHVVMEPSSDFSFHLNYLTENENPYGGNIGVCVQSAGLKRKFFLGGVFPTKSSLQEAVLGYTISIASGQSLIGAWSWQELQTEHAKHLRRLLKESDSSSWQDYGEQLEKELASAEKLISELQAEIKRKIDEEIETIEFGDSILPNELVEMMGKELFPGEFSDRIRYLIIRATGEAFFQDLDVRSKNLATQFIEKTNSSRRSNQLIAEIKQAGNKGKRFGDHMANILKRLGFGISEDGKHMKATPPKDGIGGPTLTLPKTSSDKAHGGANNANNTINELGLKSIK